MTILVSYQAVPLTFYNKIAPMVTSNNRSDISQRSEISLDAVQ